MSNDFTPEPIANYYCEVGEGPLWDDRKQVLYWTDIPQGRLFRYDPNSGKHEQIYSGEPVGGMILEESDSLLLFQVNKFSRLYPDGKLEVLKDNIDSAMDRFNDVIADPAGRVFAGTIGTNDECGGLYRIDTDGKVTRLFQGTGCANGMGFSPDLKLFYYTCTTHGTVSRFNYNQETGEITNRTEIIKTPIENGYMDGLTIDTEGNIWSARWGGYAVHKYSPEGNLLDTIKLPVEKVSCPTFGGPELGDLYVTTAGGTGEKPEEETADGTLYRVKIKAKGRPEFRSKILPK